MLKLHAPSARIVNGVCVYGMHTNKNIRLLDIIIGLLIAVLLFYRVSIINFASTIISPLVSSHNQKVSSAAIEKTQNVFSYAPGWAFNNLSLIEFNNLKILAYYDVPILEDGSLYKDNDGYLLFVERIGELLEKTHGNGTKLVLTLTQADNKATKSILNDPDLQRKLIDEISYEVFSTGIDGININFDFKDPQAKQYQTAFTRFIQNLSQQIKNGNKNAIVTVSVPSTPLKNSLFDEKRLANITDGIFMDAYDFAVPEMKNASVVAPLYGYSNQKFWSRIINAINQLLHDVPRDKLFIERAWYGNGDAYPLPKPHRLAEQRYLYIGDVSNTFTTPLSQDVIERVTQDLSGRARIAAQKNLPIIAKALEGENILTPNILAYAMATIEHETAGTFEPIEEILGRKSARRLGYEGGTNYFGRGFIQLTHLRNYKNVGRRIGIGDDLVENPELALNPIISAKILAAYFKDYGIASLANNGDFISARTPINPDYQGWWIANLAYKYLWAMG